MHIYGNQLFFQGKGYGLQLFNHAMQYLGQRRIGLDGLLVQVSNYKKSGFQCLHYNRRYLLKKWKSLSNHNNDDTSTVEVLELNEKRDFEILKSFDIRYFPAPRDSWLKGLLSSASASTSIPKHNVEAICLGTFSRESNSEASSTISNILTGFGVIRKSETGYRIGPLYATSSLIATWLGVYSFKSP